MSRAEFEFIERLKATSRTQTAPHPNVRLGIGDDAAVLHPMPGNDWISTVDVLVEGVHFHPETSWELVGRKALAVNLSDVAAMAAEPVAAFIGLVLPQQRPVADVDALYRGLQSLAETFGVTLAGGDTNTWAGPLVLSVTLLGSVAAGRAVLRSGAVSGDWLFVSGPLGGSLESGRHLTFTPRVDLARELANSYALHALLDISDGLASDLWHLTNSSGVGAVIDAASIPVHQDVSATLPAVERLQRALTDGEDFELLFAVSPESGQALLERGSLHGTTPVRIGTCTSDPAVKLFSEGKEEPFPVGGWCHQFGQPNRLRV